MPETLYSVFHYLNVGWRSCFVVARTYFPRWIVPLVQIVFAIELTDLHFDLILKLPYLVID